MLISSQEYVSQVKAEIQEITCEEMRNIKDTVEVLIDIREPEETSLGMIEGAVAIPRGVLEMKLCEHPLVKGKQNALQILEDKTIYLYCRSGARSALAAKSLSQMGFKNVYSLAGGINEWNNQK